MIVSWTFLKELLSAGLRYSYLTTPSTYLVFIRDHEIKFSCDIIRDGSDDVVDFETNYQAGATPFISSAWNSFINLTGNATTTVKSGPTALVQIIINTNNSGGTVTIYDSLSASGTQVGRMQIGTPSGALGAGLQSPGVYIYGIQLALGLTIVTAGAAGNNITVLYR